MSDRDDKDGGAAFLASGEGNWAPTPGMSLRDWFAGQALQWMMARTDESHGGYPHRDKLVKSAYDLADAMLR